MMGFFDYARNEGFPTMYPSHKTAVAVDVLEAGLILACVMLAACSYVVILGYKGNYQAVLFMRVTLSLLIGGILMICNFGQAWEVGEIETRTAYKAGQPHEINATISVKIGLRSVNVTLLQTEEDKMNSKLKGEKIDYNERFWWTWDQGRFGFGPYAGILQQSFRAAQRRGLPLPILWVVDYFTIDGEGLRYGRHYRTAGWYAHIVMWAAFPCWLLANVTFLSVVRYGGYFTALTGAFQLLACLLWSVIRNPNELIIPFENGNLTTKYGPNFWLTLISGIACIIIAVVIIVLDLQYPDNIAVFFGKDPLTDYDEYYSFKENRVRSPEPDTLEMNDANALSGEAPISQTECVLKRRTTLKRVQRGLIRTTSPTITVNDDDDDTPLYLNVPRGGFANTIPEEASGSQLNLYNEV